MREILQWRLLSLSLSISKHSFYNPDLKSGKKSWKSWSLTRIMFLFENKKNWSKHPLNVVAILTGEIWTGEEAFKDYSLLHLFLLDYIGKLCTYFDNLSFVFSLIVKILNPYIILYVYSIVSLLSVIYPFPAMHSLLVTICTFIEKI